MAQSLNSSRLSNTSVNINGANASTSTNFGLQRIGITGNSFDISASGTVTLGATGSGNVTLGNSTAGSVSFAGPTTFANINGATTTSTISVGSNLISGGIVALGSTASTTNLFGTLDVANIEGPTAGTAMTIGNNISAGSISIGNAGAANTVTIGNNGASATGTVNVGVSSNLVNIGTSKAGTVTIGATGGTVNVGVTGSNVYVGENANTVFIGRSVYTVIGGGTQNVDIGASSAYSGSIFIGTGSNNRGTISIGTTGTAAVSLGSVSAPLTLRGSTTTFSSPLTLGTAPPFGATGTGVGATTLGSSYFISIAGLTAGSGDTIMPASPPLIPRGTWLYHYVFKCPGTSPTVCTIDNILTGLYINGPSPPSAGAQQITGVQNATLGVGLSGSGVIAVTDDTTVLGILVRVNYTVGGPLFTNATSNFQLTRLA